MKPLLGRDRVTLRVSLTPVQHLSRRGGGGEAQGRVGHRLGVDAARYGGGLGVKYRQIGRHGGTGVAALRKVQVFLCLGAADSKLGLVVSQVTGGLLWLGWDCYPAGLTAAIFLILIIMTFFFRECF